VMVVVFDKPSNCYHMHFCDTPVGKLTIADNSKSIVRISLALPDDSDQYKLKETPLIAKAKKELDEYFSGKRFEFSLPLEPQGTNYLKNVWKILCDIPYGETRSYGDIAMISGKPSAGRAVGMATNRNPILIVIPCHRVIGNNGKLIGYAYGLGIKQKLLDLERNYKR